VYWGNLKLPQSATMIRRWEEKSGIPYYAPKLKIWYIEQIAKYFNLEPHYFTDEIDITDNEFSDKIENTPTVTENGMMMQKPESKELTRMMDSFRKGIGYFVDE
jgi:hypothetical protein